MEQREEMMSGEQSETVNQDQQAPLEGPNPAAEEAQSAEEIPVENTEDRIAALEQELEETKAKWLRAVAEEQNVRRRSEKEKQDALKYGVTSFAREMVGVADNLGRALASAPEEVKGSDLMTGIEMTEKELQNAFNKAGIKRVDALGKPFDHNYHQAVFEIDDPSQAAGLVGQVMQEGYVIHDRLLRPAMVGVTKGGPAYEAPAAEAKADNAEDAAAQAEAYEAQQANAGQSFDQET